MEAIKRKELLEDSKVFCMAPWVHLHFNPQGQVFPCCISAHFLEERLGDLSLGEKLTDTWNSDRMKDLRLSMLEGRHSKLCGLCYKYERIGQESPRQDMNRLFGQDIGLVNKTRTDGAYEEQTIRFVDFRFSNICNYKCRICSHHFSSKWYEDARAIGWITDETDRGRLVAPVDDMEALWDQIEPVLSGIEKIQFAGGEPLVMAEHYRILDYFVEHGMYEVNITYNTNFSTFRFKDTDVLDRWKVLRNVSLAASLDGMGPRGDYMRKGQRWADVEQNRRRMLEECPHVRFQLTPTISIMNVLHFPDFYRDWVDRGFIGPHDFNIYMLFEPEFYSIRRLPPEMKKRVEAKYHHFMDGYISGLPEPDRIRAQFERVLTHMNEEHLEMLPRFREFTGQLDRLRSEDTRAIFPELSDLL